MTSSWRDEAACAGSDPGLFYPGRAEMAEAVARAREVCASCPVRAECLDHAESVPERWGIWGGTTALDREAARTGLTMDEALARRRPPPTPALDPIRCHWLDCAIWFTPTTPTQRYHSPRCTAAAGYHRRRARRKVE